MSSRSKEIRREMLRNKTPSSHHSMDSNVMNSIVGGERNMYRVDKASKAMARRAEREELAAIYEGGDMLQDFQFARAATKVNHGLSTSEDREYIRRHEVLYKHKLVSTEVGLRVIGNFQEQEVQIPQRVTIVEFLSAQYPGEA